MVLILLTTVRLSGAKTQRSPSPRAPLQSVHIEPLCSRVLHPPFTLHLHKQTHFLPCPTFVSTILWEKANETDVHLSNYLPYLCSQLLLVICWGGCSSGAGRPVNRSGDGLNAWLPQLHVELSLSEILNPQIVPEPPSVYECVCEWVNVSPVDWKSYSNASPFTISHLPLVCPSEWYKYLYKSKSSNCAPKTHN